MPCISWKYWSYLLINLALSLLKLSSSSALSSAQVLVSLWSILLVKLCVEPLTGRIMFFFAELIWLFLEFLLKSKSPPLSYFALTFKFHLVICFSSLGIHSGVYLCLAWGLRIYILFSWIICLAFYPSILTGGNHWGTSNLLGNYVALVFQSVCSCASKVRLLVDLIGLFKKFYLSLKKPFLFRGGYLQCSRGTGLL